VAADATNSAVALKHKGFVMLMSSLFSTFSRYTKDDGYDGDDLPNEQEKKPTTVRTTKDPPKEEAEAVFEASEDCTAQQRTKKPKAAKGAKGVKKANMPKKAGQKNNKSAKGNTADDADDADVEPIAQGSAKETTQPAQGAQPERAKEAKWIQNTEYRRIMGDLQKQPEPCGGREAYALIHKQTSSTGVRNWEFQICKEEADLDEECEGLADEEISSLLGRKRFHLRAWLFASDQGPDQVGCEPFLEQRFGKSLFLLKFRQSWIVRMLKL